MKRRQFFLKCSVKNITQADFLDRLKQNSWEIIGNQASLMVPLRLLKCKSRRCRGCLYFEEKSHFSNDDSDFPILGGWIKLLFENIIYIIECRACGDKYVGETWRCLKDRMFNHTSDTNWNKDGPVSRYSIMLTILVWDRRDYVSLSDLTNSW